jgi:hypothetical protein
LSINNPAEDAVIADLTSVRFRTGVARGQWRKISFSFPILILGITSIGPDGSKGEGTFRFEVNGFPGVDPEVRIWDLDADRPLAVERRPRGSSRIVEAFKSWEFDTVYRPWERRSGAHNDWKKKYPDLAWHSSRDLTFILEDLYGLLTSNGAARSTGASA